MGLILRKHADKSTGERIDRFDPVMGAKRLINPATPGNDHEPWPLAGVTIEHLSDGPVNLSTTLVADGIREGWIEGVNERPVVRPAGPEQHVWASGHTGQPHVFLHYDALVFHTLDGDVEFTVTHQPDKYADFDAVMRGRTDAVEPFEADDETPVTPEMYTSGATRVDHFYTVTEVKG